MPFLTITPCGNAPPMGDDMQIIAAQIMHRQSVRMKNAVIQLLEKPRLPRFFIDTDKTVITQTFLESMQIPLIKKRKQPTVDNQMLMKICHKKSSKNHPAVGQASSRRKNTHVARPTVARVSHHTSSTSNISDKNSGSIGRSFNVLIPSASCKTVGMLWSPLM